jgi:VWFA-related protein
MRILLHTLTHRPAAHILCGLVLPLAACIARPQLLAQTTNHDTPVLTMNARTVIVDVVVTGKDGKPITGLRKDDFTVSEDDHPQVITSFDEHSSAAPQAPLPPLPPNVFTNVPRSTPTGSPVVLLLDSLNTPLADQAFVHQQMLRYLQQMQPGTPMAVFTLGSKLNFIQGFTDDPAILRAVAQNIHSGAGPQTSPLLKSQAETTNEQLAVAQIAATRGEAQLAAALQQFQAEQKASQDSTRILLTLDALQQLAHYLAGIPGRKSIAWFSGAFPTYIFPNQALSAPSAIERGFSDEIRRADAALSAAQVAMYPIAAEGLANDSLYNADTQLTGQSAYAIQQQSIANLNTDATSRNGNHATMDQIAKETGGEAFYNTNGIDKAIARVAENGSHYYTLSYTPAQPPAEDQFRKIKIKLASGHYNLAYREGYFTADTRSAPKVDADPLRPFMQPGTPDTTEIPLALLVQPLSTMQTNPAECAGDNHSLSGPFTCYAAQFVIAARGLQLNTSTDGSHHGSIEVTLLASDSDGKPLNWIVRQVNLDMDAARYAEVQASGAHLTLALGIPQTIASADSQSAATLRAGVYDRLSGRAGTLSVPLASIISKPNPLPTSH